MIDSSSAIANIQKLIKQLQKDVMSQTLKQHAESLSKIHQLMREHSLTPDLVAMSYKPRKPRAKKDVAETKISSPVNAPAMQK